MPANLPLTPDTELIQQSRDGDESAYGQLVQRYQSLVCSVAYSRCGDLGMSEDLAQEAFIQAWKKLADLSDVNKFKSWICTIVRNMASRSYENSKRNVATSAAGLDSVVEPASNANDPIDRVISAEQEQLVWHAIADIPENYREPMILFYREEQSVARVAAALDISQDAVKQRLARGRKFLQEQLVATVEATLESSKPSQAFTGAVLLGLSGIKAKTATAGVAATIAGKTAAAGGGGMGSMFLASFAQLPLIPWLLKSGLDETRSSRERKLMIQFILIWGLALIPLVLFFRSGVSIPIAMAIYCIPMIAHGYRMGKRIEQLRIEEKTATPYRPIVANQEQQGVKTRLFLGSGTLIAMWPVAILTFGADWLGVGLMLIGMFAISLAGARFCGSSPKTSFRVYGLTLGCMSLVGIAVLYYRPLVWSDRLAYHSFWFLLTLQAMTMTQVILTMIVWKRVFGKPK
jgi:RNA polymerase sigma factor (sigma-70 family)